MAMTSPTRAMKKKEPNEAKSFLSVKPMKDITANIPAVTKKAPAIELIVNLMKMNDMVTPFKTE